MSAKDNISLGVSKPDAETVMFSTKFNQSLLNPEIMHKQSAEFAKDIQDTASNTGYLKLNFNLPKDAPLPSDFSLTADGRHFQVGGASAAQSYGPACNCGPNSEFRPKLLHSEDYVPGGAWSLLKDLPVQISSFAKYMEPVLEAAKLVKHVLK